MVVSWRTSMAGRTYWGRWQPARLRQAAARVRTRRARPDRRAGDEKRDSGNRAARERGDSGGGSVGSPRWRRNLATPSGSRTRAITLVRPPQWSQVSRSMAKVRRSSSTKGRYFERCVGGDGGLAAGASDGG